MLGRIKRIILGQPLSNQMAIQERIPKWKGLAILSSDALSSVAYATEEVLIPLAAFGLAAYAYSVPIAVAITLLLIIVMASYRQTIEAYPGGSGAYFVVKENLGARAGLFAGASLLIDYVLTVAVSVSAGVENIASALPALQGHEPGVGALIIFFLMMLNLRGVRETAPVFALPAYAFIFSIASMLVAGAWQLYNGTAVTAPPVLHDIYPEVPLFVLLRAFASGCAALTGVEAISDGVQLFRPPAQRNAKITLVWMCVILGSMFLGITMLAHAYGVIPQQETAVSLLARSVFGEHYFYYIVQASTASILILAANTAYVDFPRVCSFLARDRFLPRQLASVGDRLVFSNGILGLSLAAAFLIFFFKDTHHLIPLYAVGVFLSFTLSQAGMVKYHLKERKLGWRSSISLNALGMVTTALVLVVIAVTKFMNGAWMVIALIPLLVLLFSRINRHYLSVGKELTLTDKAPPGKLVPLKHTVIVPISGIHRGVLDALRYALSISTDVRACYVEIDPAATERMKEEWRKWAHEVPFVVLKSPYRSVIAPLLEYIDDVEQTTHGDMITIIVPEFVTSRWWHQILHNQTAFLIRAALIFRPGKVVTSVRYHLRES
jgi:amino acid transporter